MTTGTFRYLPTFPRDEPWPPDQVAERKRLYEAARLEPVFSRGKLNPHRLENLKYVDTWTSHSRNRCLASWLQVAAANPKVVSLGRKLKFARMMMAKKRNPCSMGLSKFGGFLNHDAARQRTTDITLRFVPHSAGSLLLYLAN